MGRQQGMLAHEPQQAFARHPHAIDRAQPGPDLPMSFAGPRGSLEVGADRGEQRLVADAGLGSRRAEADAGATAPACGWRAA